jgi:hypothetical protein
MGRRCGLSKSKVPGLSEARNQLGEDGSDGKDGLFGLIVTETPALEPGSGRIIARTETGAAHGFLNLDQTRAIPANGQTY